MPGPIVIPDLPEWLKEASAAHALLSDEKRKASARILPAGQKRTVFLRDTEIFVAHGKEIRCADLKVLKSTGAEAGGSPSDAYQILGLKDLDFDVTQIIKNDDSDTMIIAGEYDVAVSFLPAPGVITPGHRLDIPIKSFKLGSKDLSYSKSRVLRALWHPLGASLSVVVLTDDAMLRIYEVDFEQPESFDLATETFDLKSMHGIDRNASYVIDDIEPSSICFGGVGSVWSPMTLYVLMKNGDIFSICPFLPTKWKTDDNLLDEFAYQLRYLEELSDEATPLEKYRYKQEGNYIRDIIRSVRIRNVHRPLYSDPHIMQKRTSSEFEIPILQGPYLLQPAPEEIYDDDIFASDIARIGTARFALLAVAYSSGRVDMLLEYDSIGPRWFSKALKYKKFNDRAPYPILAGFESIDVPLPQANEVSASVYPTLSFDVHAPQTLLLNHGFGVELINVEDWMSKLSTTLNEVDDESVIESTLESLEGSSVSHVIGKQRGVLGGSNPVLGSALIYDAYLGYLLVAATTLKPGFAVLEWPSKFSSRLRKAVKESKGHQVSTPASTSDSKALMVLPRTPIAAVTPPTAALQQSRAILNDFKRGIDRRTLTSEFAINNDNLQVLSRLQQILNQEMDIRFANAVEIHASAERQKERFHSQIKEIRDFAQHLKEREREQIELREKYKQAQQRQQVIKERIDTILSKLVAISRKGGYPSTSEAEEAYVEEIHGIERICGSVKKREQEIRDFLESLGSLSLAAAEASKVTPKKENEAEDANRTELTNVVLKEHKRIADLRNRVVALEGQFKEVKLGA